MKATFEHSDDINHNVRTFWFHPSQPVQYTAGQFTQLYLPHDKPDDRGIKRYFTLSSSPSDELLSITTKFDDERVSSFKQTLAALKPGAEIEFDEPMGDFVLPKLVQTPLVFVAGGIGLTPLHSMCQWLIDTGEERNIRLFYGVDSEDDIIFHDVFDKADVRTTIVVNKPTPSWGGERGLVTANMIMGVDKPTDDTLFYLSGPEPMLEILKKDLIEHGIDHRHIVTDFFPGYTSL